MWVSSQSEPGTNMVFISEHWSRLWKIGKSVLPWRFLESVFHSSYETRALWHLFHFSLWQCLQRLIVSLWDSVHSSVFEGGRQMKALGKKYVHGKQVGLRFLYWQVSRAHPERLKTSKRDPMSARCKTAFSVFLCACVCVHIYFLMNVYLIGSS